jgi:uncharacterized protein YacL
LNGVFVELVRLLVVLLATAGGFALGRHGSSTGNSAILGATLGALVGYVAGGLFGRLLSTTRLKVEKRVERVPAVQLLAGAVGAVALGGLCLLVAVPLALLAPGRWGWPIVTAWVWGGVVEGARLGAHRSRDLLAMAGLRPVLPGRPPEPDATLVDTSAIIDGRLLALGRAGFLDATLLVPRFILDELQAIADAADPARRRRGRRGLEALDALRHVAGVSVRVLDDEIPEVHEVDAKLITLARRLDARLVTVDGALQRIAELQGIRCLNLDQLADGLRPLHLPGEIIHLPVLRAGKEPGQGVGFLEDGTMVVVTNAASLVGQEVPVQVTSGTQTSMGRMLFASLAGDGAP